MYQKTKNKKAWIKNFFSTFSYDVHFNFMLDVQFNGKLSADRTTGK